MTEAAASRIAADLCWFFMLFCLLSPVLPALWLLGLFAAACLLLGFPALRAGHAALRLLCTLPALSLCLLAPDTATRVALGAGWLYFALAYTLGRLQMEHWAYRRAFLAMGAVALLAVLIALLSSSYVSEGRMLAARMPDAVGAFAGAFALLGFYTLRAIRMGVSTDLGWKAFGALELALPAAAGGALFVLLRLLFRHAGAVFTVLAAPFALLFRLITELLSLLSSGRDMGQLGGDTTEDAPPELFDPPPSVETGTVEAASGEIVLPEPPPIPWGSILAVLAIAAALVLVIYYLRKGKFATDRSMERITEEHFRVFHRKTRHPPPKDHAERVRQCYAAYLRFLELHGQSIGRGDTSLDVLTASERPLCLPGEEQTLRRLYLTARYGDAGSVSAADAEEAERCLDAIRASILEPPAPS